MLREMNEGRINGDWLQIAVQETRERDQLDEMWDSMGVVEGEPWDLNYSETL